MKYNVGDKVRIKSTDWYNENKDASGDVLCFYGVHKFTKEMSKFCDKTVTISTNLTGDGEYLIKEDNETNWWTDEMIEGLVEDTITTNEQSFKPSNISLEKEMEWNLPNGYIFKDENGNVINATKIVLEKKKKEYPKTYEECLNELDIHEVVAVCGWEKEIKALQTLLVCRDAYWKIAGEEMGLGKPWEPDWINEHQVKYTIYTMGNDVIRHVGNYIHAILAFPTEEMRDAFKENFDSDLEICKELL